MKDYYVEFQKYNLILLDILSTEKKTVSFKFRCASGHVEKISRSRWDAGSRCRSCTEHQQLSSLVQKENYSLLEIKKSDQGTRLYLRCPKDHTYDCLVGSWNQGHRCRQCNQPSYDIDKVRKLFEAEGYKLTSNTYRNAHTKLDFICPNRHSYQITLNAWNNGTRCGMCDKNYLPKDIATLLKKQGIELLSTPSNACDRMHLRWSSCNHEKRMMYYELLKQGSDCKTCSRNQIKNDINISYIEGLGFRVEDFSKDTYAHDHITLTCPKLHKFKITWTNFQQGHRCPICMNRTSLQQLELSNTYKTLGIELKENYRKLIYPKEVDIFFPKQNLAIEYCGLYWHSDQRDGMISSYHYDKMIGCNNKGVRLITIFEDEWLNYKEICLARINHALGINVNKTPARSCRVVEIDKSDAYDFLKKYHLQGPGKSSVCFGLFIGDKLVQVMTGGSPNRNHTSKSFKILEMKRLASHPDYTIVGGAGKLFKALKSYALQNNYDQIKSYCDMRWGTGNLYKQLGFKLTGATKYTPHYIKNGKRFRNQTLKRPKDCLLTEREFNLQQGYSIIYDCGHQTWLYDLKNK